jgi:Flp pilus assembly protein TadB
MKRNLLFAFGLMCLFLCAQCTVQKRIYRKGWYISFKKEWRNPKNDQSQQFVSENERKNAVDLATVADFTPLENTLTETELYDSVPQSNSATEEMEISTQNVSTAPENEDTISKIAADAEQLASKHSKASTRPAWVKKLAIFLFCVAVILIIALLIASSPVDLATSTTFAGISLAIIFLAFLIGFSAYNNRNKKRPKKPVEKKMRLLTAEEQAEKKSSRKRGAIVVTVFSAIVLLLFVLGAITLGNYLFLIPVALIVAFLIIIAWIEYKRPRSKEMTEDVVVPDKQYRKKSEAEMQAETKAQKRKSLVSAIFWTLVFGIFLLIVIPMKSYVFLFFGCLICLAFIMGACLEFFKWKPNDVVEIKSIPQKETIEDTPTPDNDEPVKPKSTKTDEEQRTANRKRNIVVGIFFAIIAAFFIIGAND